MSLASYIDKDGVAVITGGASESAGGASGAAESQSDFVKYGYRAIVSASTGGGEIQSPAPSVEEGVRS